MAYIVFDEVPSSSEAAPGTTISHLLRDFLQTKLPDYMVPSTFVRLDTLPLTSNGKVDRKALLAVDDGPQQEAVYVAPQGTLEESLAAVAREILNIDKIGVHRNFFEVGGTSLHLVRMASRLRELLGKEIPLADMFRYPTISTLASRLSNEQRDEAVLEKTQARAEARRASRTRRRGV